MYQSRFLIIISLLSIITLSGCISKIPKEVSLENIPLTEENSAVVQRDHFSVRVPDNFKLVLDNEYDHASLYRIDNPAGDSPMIIEETTVEIDLAIKELLKNPAAKKVSQQSITINDHNGIKLLIEADNVPGVIIPYYFLEGDERNYVFSLINGEPFIHFNGIVNSFSAK